MGEPYPKKKIVLICRTVVFYALRATGKALPEFTPGYSNAFCNVDIYATRHLATRSVDCARLDLLVNV